MSDHLDPGCTMFFTFLFFIAVSHGSVNRLLSLWKGLLTVRVTDISQVEVGEHSTRKLGQCFERVACLLLVPF